MQGRDWRAWLEVTTGRRTVRGIAQVAGVSHPTVLRWIAEGVPHRRAWELTVRFHADPALTCVMLGYVAAEDVHLFNFEAVVQYAPTWVLTAELDRRARETREQYPHIKLQRRVAGL